MLTEIRHLASLLLASTGRGDERVEVRSPDPHSPLPNPVGRQFPGITQRLFDGGQVRRFVNVYLNDEDIRYLDNLQTAVKDGDAISIIPAVAGG